MPEVSPPQIFPVWYCITNERRWFLQFFVGILLCINNGACFCFALFSKNLTLDPFRFTQSEINTIATVGVLLSYFSFPTGYLYDKKGPALTILTGTILNATGWLGVSVLFRSSMDSRFSLLLVIVFYGLSQLSASFFETSAMLTNLKAFSCYQGRVVMIQKTFMGLGTSLAAQVYYIFFNRMESIPSFLLFLSVYSAVVGCLSFSFIAVPSQNTMCLGLNVVDESTVERGGGEPLMFKKPFNVGTLLLIASVFAVLSMSFIENCLEVQGTLKILFGTVTIGLCCSFLLMTIATPSYECNVNGYLEQPLNSREEYCNPEIFCELLTDVCVEKNMYDSVASNDQKSSFKKIVSLSSEKIIVNNKTLLHNLKQKDLWFLWFTCFASWSSMTLISSNCSQIYQALSYGDFDSIINAVYVSVFGVASAFGRIIVGFVHPFLQKQGVAITLLCSGAPLLNCLGLPLFLLLPVSFLFIPFFFVGLATGVSWGSTILVVTTLYAPSHCGKHYSFLYTAGMLSPIVFNLALFGPFYDYYSAQQGDSGVCRGVKCIFIPIIFCFFINLISFPASCILIKRSIANCGV